MTKEKASLASRWDDPANAQGPHQIIGLAQRSGVRDKAVSLARLALSRASGDAEIAVTAEGGTVNGILQWIRLDLDDTVTYENRPAPGTRSNWAALFHRVAEFATEVGQQVSILDTHDERDLRIWVDAS